MSSVNTLITVAGFAFVFLPVGFAVIVVIHETRVIYKRRKSERAGTSVQRETQEGQ